MYDFLCCDKTRRKVFVNFRTRYISHMLDVPCVCMIFIRFYNGLYLLFASQVLISQILGLNPRLFWTMFTEEPLNTQESFVSLVINQVFSFSVIYLLSKNPLLVRNGLVNFQNSIFIVKPLSVMGLGQILTHLFSYLHLHIYSFSFAGYLKNSFLKRFRVYNAFINSLFMKGMLYPLTVFFLIGACMKL